MLFRMAKRKTRRKRASAPAADHEWHQPVGMMVLMQRELFRLAGSAVRIAAPAKPILEDIGESLVFLCEAISDPAGIFTSDRLIKPLSKNDRIHLSPSERFLRAYLASPRTFLWAMAHLTSIYERFSVATRALEQNEIRFKNGKGEVVKKPTEDATIKEILQFVELEYGVKIMGKDTQAWCRAIKQCRHRLVKVHREIDEFIRTWWKASDAFQPTIAPTARSCPLRNKAKIPKE
jgi:hypothetical protein